MFFCAHLPFFWCLPTLKLYETPEIAHAKWTVDVCVPRLLFPDHLITTHLPLHTVHQLVDTTSRTVVTINLFWSPFYQRWGKEILTLCTIDNIVMVIKELRCAFSTAVCAALGFGIGRTAWSFTGISKTHHERCTTGASWGRNMHVETLPSEIQVHVTAYF